MTVLELIDELKKCPPDTQVRMVGGRNIETTEITLLPETRFGGKLDIIFISGE